MGFLLVEPVRNPIGIGETKPLPGTYLSSVRGTCMYKYDYLSLAE